MVKVTELEKVYQTGEIKFQALRGISLEIQAGDFVAIMGESGSGKSTLLHVIGGLDQPTSGSVWMAGQQLDKMNETELARFRRSEIGFVFQFFNLIENLTVRANVELPALLEDQLKKKEIRRRSEELLERLGISDQANKHPWELSGGQQQRVAIARAFINFPTLLLADEPTGNLDTSSGDEVLDILKDFNQGGQTTLMVTHAASAAKLANYVLFIRDGLIVDRMPGGNEKAIARRLIDLRQRGS
ncbi:MAG: ABC transporter ATP-binding protein [Anaerolineales bacterium]|nr:ABC transporter ATP-binding protein [Anaerolineales bacterium]